MNKVIKYFRSIIKKTLRKKINWHANCMFNLKTGYASQILHIDSPGHFEHSPA